MRAAEHDAKEWSESGRSGSGNSDTDFDSGPDCDVAGSPEEVLDVGHAADERDTDDCCCGGTVLESVINDQKCVYTRMNIHGTNRQNATHRQLGPNIHLQFHHDENGKNAQDPVTGAADSGVGV